MFRLVGVASAIVVNTLSVQAGYFGTPTGGFAVTLSGDRAGGKDSDTGSGFASSAGSSPASAN